MRRLPVLLVSLVATTSLAGCVDPGAVYAPHAAASDAALRVPVVHLQFPAVGVYENDVNAMNEPRSYADVARFGDTTRTSVRIAMYYTNWGTPFDTSFAVQAARHGAVPLVTLQPYISVARIADGQLDSYLRSFAAEVKAFRDPVIISFGHEMNGCWYPWGPCKTPARVFTAAWRHIVTVFRQMKVSNVRWLWEANVGRPKPLRADYPGNKWVSYVGVTGYYTQASSTFQNELAQTVDQVRKYARKPMIIGETGIAPDRDRPEQIRNLFAELKAYHVIAVVYFDVDQKHTNLYKQDWRLEGDGAALSAYRAAAKAYLKR